MKHAIVICILLIPTITHAKRNPMFGIHTRNSIGIYAAQSTGNGDLDHLIEPWEWDFSPMTLVMLQYSQPLTFLRLPGRINIHALQNFAYRGARGASFGAMGISLDVLLASWCGFYFGVGMGPYMRDSGDDYVDSRLVFGERIFIGKQITPRLHAEIFTLHFSNGDFTEPNHGFNFAGLGINFSF